MAIGIPASTELIAIIERNFESKGLDYKGPMEWDSNDKKSCCELTKDVIGMANTGGGYIVVGVSELDSGFMLEGLSSAQAASFESSTICRFIQNYVDPPINVRVQKVMHNARTFVVLEVPRFTDTPHICQKDFPKVLSDRELYVRTDNNETAPIRSSADFRLLIESAIRNRADSLLSAFRSILSGNDANRQPRVPSVEEQFTAQIKSARSQFENRNTLREKKYSFFAETIFSLDDFDQYRFTPEELELAAHKASVDFTGWPFLFIHHNRADCLSITGDGLESFIATQDFAGHDMLDFWRFNESGLFFKKELPFNAASNPPQASVPWITRHFAEAIYCMTRLYEDLLTDSHIISLEVKLLGTRHRALVWSEMGFPSGSRYRANRPELEVRASHTLSDWRTRIEEYAVEMTSELLLFFHLDQPDRSQLGGYVQKLFQRRF